MGVDFSPIVFDTWGGLHGAGKEVVKAMFRCTAPLLPSARPAAVGSLRQGLGVQMGCSVSRQLEALMMVTTEAPAWWAAALPPIPATTAAGNPRWWGNGQGIPCLWHTAMVPHLLKQPTLVSPILTCHSY